MLVEGEGGGQTAQRGNQSRQSDQRDRGLEGGGMDWSLTDTYFSPVHSGYSYPSKTVGHVIQSSMAAYLESIV